MTTLSLSTDVLAWAAHQMGSTYESLVKGLARREADRERLLQGQLTNAQAEKFSRLTGVPFGLLFLSAPPVLQRPRIPDLRQEVAASPLSKDFQETYEDALRKQAWYREHVAHEGAEALPFVGKFSSKADAEKVAEDIRQTLGPIDLIRKHSSSPEDFFSRLASRVEEIGVLVMKTGIVKSNTRRPLSVAEFRGFAVADKLAPLIVVNGRDTEVATVFTLIHELAHIWVGASGISDLSVKRAEQHGIERTCNQIAASVLVPEQEFRTLWASFQDVSILAQRFRVSRLVIARRAFDFGMLTQREYEEIAAQSSRAKTREPGGDSYRVIPVRNSKRFTVAIVKSAMAGETLIRDAASLLNIKPATVVQLGRRI